MTEDTDDIGSSVDQDLFRPNQTNELRSDDDPVSRWLRWNLVLNNARRNM
jgi:hypothetical protein